MRKIFDENRLRSIIKEMIGKEMEKYEKNIEKLWGYLNKLREEFIIN